MSLLGIARMSLLGIASYHGNEGIDVLHITESET